VITIDEDHIYRVDDRIVPVSVTGLLKYAGLIDDRYFSEYGRIRGQLTHRAIQWHNEGTLDEDSLDPALEPYFRAYVRFLVDSGFVVTGSEIKVYSEEWDYAGTLDIKGYFKKSPHISYIGDTKCNKVFYWTGIQTAFYARARLGYNRRFGLELHKNSTYKIVMFETILDWEEGLRILKKYKEERNGRPNV
jgi:hypothetical protein